MGEKIDVKVVDFKEKLCSPPKDDIFNIHGMKVIFLLLVEYSWKYFY